MLRRWCEVEVGGGGAGKEGRTVKCDRGQYEADNHARGGPDHDLPAADDVDILQSEQSEEEVRARNDDTDGRGLVEADLLPRS